MPAKKTTRGKTPEKKVSPKNRTGKGAGKWLPGIGTQRRPAAKVIGVESAGPGLDAFVAVGNKLNGAEGSQMFGKPCFKVKGKAFTCFFNGDMVFKLGGKAHDGAMKLKGAKLFDPSGKGRAMKEWVQVPVASKSKWNALANEAMSYVKTTAK